MFFLCALQQIMFFGWAFVANEGAMQILVYIISSTFFLATVCLSVPRYWHIDTVTHLSLKRLHQLTFLLGPMLIVIQLIAFGAPLLSDNPNIARVIFRDMTINKWITFPVSQMFIFATILLAIVEQNRKMILLLLMCSLIMFFTAFRAATIVPFVQLVIASYILKNPTMKPLLPKIVITIGAGIIAVVALFLTYIRSDSGDVGTVLQLLVERITSENYIINHGRYVSFLNNHGLQLGGTYFNDILSVFRIVDNSFQESLTDAQYVVMNTPLFSELYVNFGDYSFIGIVPLSIMAFLVISASIILFRKKFKPLMLMYLVLALNMSILQAGYSKYFFVDLPKYVILLFILTKITNLRLRIS